jgi:hypothetical protein
VHRPSSARCCDPHYSDLRSRLLYTSVPTSTNLALSTLYCTVPLTTTGLVEATEGICPVYHLSLYF